MAAVPSEYATPQGCLLLVEVDGAPMGGVGLRPLGTGVPEIKRLYVRPGTRGIGFGRLLVAEIVALGRSIGYRMLRLDTIRGLIVGVERMYQHTVSLRFHLIMIVPLKGRFTRNCALLKIAQEPGRDRQIDALVSL